MRSIWKYQISISQEVGSFSIPGEGSRIVFVACNEPHVLTFWVEVVLENLPETREFRVYGTGHYIDEGYDYRGSAVDGEFVWHLFEKVIAVG